MANCGECGAETRAKNTLCLDGSPLCGPCKRDERGRARIQTQGDRMACCGERMDLIDDGIYQCVDPWCSNRVEV